MSKNSFYIQRGNKTFGPLDLAQVRKLHASEKLRPTDLVSNEEAGPWHRFDAVEQHLIKPKSNLSADDWDDVEQANIEAKLTFMH